MISNAKAISLMKHPAQSRCRTLLELPRYRARLPRLQACCCGFTTAATVTQYSNSVSGQAGRQARAIPFLPRKAQDRSENLQGLSCAMSPVHASVIVTSVALPL